MSQNHSDPGLVQLVWLDVPISELKQRLRQRTYHYMPPEMLDGQIAALEPVGPDEKVMVVDGLMTPTAIVDEILSKAVEEFPILEKPWWERRIE